MEKEKTAQYNLRLPEQLKAEIEEKATEEKRSLNQQIVFLLERAIAKERSPQKEMATV
jgi:hypothetical protein